MNSRQVSKAAAMNSSISLIPVDVIHEFELLKDDGVFGVYRKVYRDDTGRVSYMIARQPSLKTPAESPASVLKEYEDETGVSLAFEHWSQFVLPPRLARKRQTRSLYKPAALNDPEQGGGLRRDPEARGWEISLEELNKRYSPSL